MRTLIAIFALLVSTFSGARAEPVRIVSWNAGPSLYEALEARLDNFREMAADLNPDVQVLIEVAGEREVQKIAQALGWPEYYTVVTNWGKLSTQVHFALEAAVISKTRILRAIEYDASPDGHHDAFSHSGPIPGIVSEEKLSSSGIPGFGDPLRHTDRGSIRVDLANGLTIFPLHLKSNRNGPCYDLENAIKTFTKMGLTVPPGAQRSFDNGFALATKENLSNARKRERVMAATARLANEAIAENRVVVIAGDMNTGFEPGKFGSKVSDCTLADFSCAKAPFPATACRNGDGYDDTLGMLEESLVGNTRWKVLSRGLGRTYDDTAFGDYAIDHIAVPANLAAKFSDAKRAAKTYGSDHFPIFAVYSP